MNNFTRFYDKHDQKILDDDILLRDNGTKFLVYCDDNEYCIRSITNLDCPSIRMKANSTNNIIDDCVRLMSCNEYNSIINK